MTAGWDGMALVGRIARPHGIRGQLVVNPETDFPQDRFKPAAILFIRRGDVVEPVTITAVRFHHGRPVITLSGVDDMATAATYAGTELRIPVEQLTPLPVGVFYEHDLVGCLVVTKDGQPVGPVSDVQGASGATRLVVQGTGGEVLIPLASDICIAIEPDARRIVVDPPEGLLALNAPDPRGTRAERRAALRRRRGLREARMRRDGS